MEWIKPLRPIASFSGFMTSLASFGLALGRIDAVALFASLECFMFLCATMVINNYIDRNHDALKNPPNDFALRNERKFLWFTIAYWTVDGIMIIGLYIIDWRLAALAFGRALLGIFYSWTRVIPCLSMISVSLACALCAATPAALGCSNHAVWVMAFSTLFAIGAREGHKDVIDFEVDRQDGWKKTVATTWGPNVAKLVTRAILVFAAIILVSLPITNLPLPCAWGAVICISLLSISAFLVQGPGFDLSKKLVDVGVAGQLLTFNASYWVLYYLSPVRTMAFGHTALTGLVLVTIVYIWLTKQWSLKKLAEVIESGLDHCEEKIKVRQGPLLWPVMYFLFFLVIALCRYICSYNAIAKGDASTVRESLLAGSIVTLWLLALVCSRIPHQRVGGRSRGYTIIERMTAGLVIGYFFGVLDRMGIHLLLVALAIPTCSILIEDLRPVEHLLKSYGCYHGIITGAAIMVGIDYASLWISISYPIIVALYYLWHRAKDIPVYIPENAPITPWMKRNFVSEDM